MELVDAVIAMAHKLHMKVVAEGVELKNNWISCVGTNAMRFRNFILANPA